MTQDELAQLSRDELIDLLLAEHGQLEALQALFAQLKADNEALKLKLEKGKKPPTNSSNSSQPPSLDHKPSLSKDRRKRKHGPPQGHPKYERKFVAKPDHIVKLKPEVCTNCHADLHAVIGQLLDVNQITELPDPKAEVIEVRQYGVDCPHCGQPQIEQPPEGLEMDRTFGARLEATVVYYRQEQHISYERTEATLQNLHGVEISQGGIDQIMERAGQKAIPEAETIQAEVCQSQVINSDETGCRVAGENWWQWVFCTLNAVLHVIRDNRSEDVIREVMGASTADVWGSDCLTSQLKAPTRERQLCLSHQIRNLQAVIDRSPPAFWAQAMQKLFRYAIHTHNQRDRLSPEAFQAKLKCIEHHCDWLLQLSLIDPDASRLQRRYQKHRQSLFVFLYRSDVSPTNNVSERALRPAVIHRKVIGCFRSKWGAHAYAALASVIDTAELNGIHAFAAIQSLFGRPSIPLPLGA
jgi:transposase